MILVELNGGLGNQLFQYAAAKSLALYTGCELKLDSTFFTQKNASAQLAYFNITESEASLEEITFFTKRSIAQKISDRAKPAYQRKIYREPSYNYDENFFRTTLPVFLKGLRQSERYFKPFKKEIRNVLTIKNTYVANITHLAEKVKSENSISIHIRRGDYLTKIALEVLGLVPLTYYNEAIGKISSLVYQPTFYIFSDDITWAKENLKINYPHTFISGHQTNNMIEDFYLMSCCRYNIIANSSFSWWAAWLNNYDRKIVIAPKKWFNKVNHDTSDLFPPEWILIN